jgi:phosphatidylglycerophosphate synthase
MAWWAFRHEQHPAPLLIGLLALTGAFAVSYSRARAEASTGEPLTAGVLGLASRDVRLLILAIGCLTGRIYGALLLIAVAANLTVALRLLYLRKRHAG